MEENYRGYKIRCEAAPIRENGHFKPIVQINWTINGHERVMLWCFGRRLATYKDAEREGLAFGKNWIDDNRSPQGDKHYKPTLGIGVST